MKQSRKINLFISVGLISISIVFWIILLRNPGNIMGIKHCHISDSGPSVKSLQMLLQMNPISSLLKGWGLMVVAMMLPKLIFPIQHIYHHSLKNKRLFLSLFFIIGYIIVWMIAGIFFVALELALQLLAPASFIPVIGFGIVTIIWQFSPFKQQCLNRGHEHWILSVFGWRAYRDSISFGIMHGIWCVGAGWALMLLPMLLPVGHNVAMLIATYVMISEHLELPRRPSWQIHFRGRLHRFIIAQTQISVTSFCIKIFPNRKVYKILKH